MAYAPSKRRLTVDEYQRMGELGILDRDERVELLDGELYSMAPIGDAHSGRVIRLTVVFTRRLGDRVLVSVQNPVRLSDMSEPQPDIAVLRPRPDFYETAKPQATDVLLIVEIAESSLDYDRTTKLPRYAAAGIPEAWIVNLVDDQIEVYRKPAHDGYRPREIFIRGDTLTLLTFPSIAIRVDELLG